MITVIDAVERKNSKGETFVALIIAGGVEMIRSKANKFYATVRKASVPSTLTLEFSKQIIGTRMNGMIVKKPCEPYMYETQGGDLIELNWSYCYTDSAENLSEEVFD